MHEVTPVSHDLIVLFQANFPISCHFVNTNVCGRAVSYQWHSSSMLLNKTCCYTKHQQNHITNCKRHTLCCVYLWCVKKLVSTPPNLIISEQKMWCLKTVVLVRSLSCRHVLPGSHFWLSDWISRCISWGTSNP